MHKDIKLKRLFYFILIPMGILLSLVSIKFPYTVETFYSCSIYKILISILSQITGIIPFSLAEVAIILILISLIFQVIIILKFLFSSDEKKYTKIINKLINGIVIISISYFVFIVVWGLNYHRLPFSEISGLNVENPTNEELRLVCVDLIDSANDLRNNINENTDGTALFQHSNKWIVNQALIAYSNATKLYSSLGGNYGKAKGVYFSTIMSYTGISGIYMPFTAEANYNTAIPKSMIPCTITHEMAHQRGFAREDEANYISYIVCKLHPDIGFKYSGTLLALIHSMNALYENNPTEFINLRKTYGVGVDKDINQLSDYWSQFEGPTEKLQNKINDAYLKSNLQQEGVKSYGRMVDLIIGEFRQKNK